MSTLNSDKNDTTKPTSTTPQYLSSRPHTDVHHKIPTEEASSGSSKTWTELQEDDPKQGRLSVVLCHQCRTLHYELMPCQDLSAEAVSSRGLLPSSAGHRLVGDRLAAESRGERGASCCRHSISWDEFFGSSLEIAPSLLSIYDTLAAQDLNLQQQHNPHPAEEDPANLHLQNPQGHGVIPGQGQGQGQPCVTSASTGLWVTDPDSQQRLFVRVGGVGLGLSSPGLSPGGLVSCSGLPPGLPPLPASGRPLSMMEAAPALKPEAAGDKENLKKRPLSISSLSSVSSTSRGRQQHKRPNLAQDTEGSASDHTSSDSNLTGPMSDRVSFTSDRASLTSDLVSMTSDPVSVTSDAVSLTSDFVSVTSDPVSLTSDAVSVTSAEDSGVGSKSATVCSDREELESSVDPDGFKDSQGGGSDPALPGGVTSFGGDVSLEHTPSGLQDQAPSITSVSSSSATQNTPSNTVPDINVDCASTTTSLDRNSASQGDSTTSCAGSSGDEASPRPPAVVMKPLQNTIRPVVISLPESIRKPRSGSSCVDGEKLPASSVPVRLEELAAGPRPALVTSLASVKTRSTPAGDSGGGVTSPGSLSATPVSKSVASSSSSSSPGSEDARSRILGMATSPGIASPTLSLSAPPFSPSTPRSPVQPIPVSSPRGSLPPQPFQLQAVSQQNSASPLSPTAIARRRFLSSHFDIPDIPPLEEPPKETPGAAESEQPMDDGQDPASSAGVRSSTLKVPTTLSFRSDASSMSSPSPSPSSAMHSSCEEFSLRGAEDISATTAGRDVSPHPAERASPTPTPASRNDRGVSPHSAEVVSSASSHASKKTSSPPHQSSSQNVHPDASSAPACGSPPLPTRGRSHHRRGGAEGEGVVGGGVGKGGGSVKGGGSYVTYVQRVVTEVVETERVYVTSLEAIIKGYLEPLRTLLVSSPKGQQDLACLFCNITDIYAFGQVFLADLEQCGLDPVRVAECFVKHNNGFVIYTDYCTNYPRAVEVLTRFMQDGELNEACKACQTRLGHGLPLGAFLLRPVQRILKYHLLLQNILKNFDKGRPGYSTLEQALGHMTAMAHHINEMKRRHEHAVRIQEVQSLLEDYSGEDLTRLGELVLEGSFRVYGAKAWRQVFLFERGILITKKKEGGMLMCKAFVLCSNLMLVEVIPNEPLSFHIIPFDNPRAQHTLQARSMEQKRHWCQEIKRLILESYKGRIPDNVKSLVMELGRNHDNDYVGKDTHDSPWKHQHTAPEYLEKRRFRRKPGGKGPDVGPLLKLPKPGGKREQSAGNKSKSPRMWRRSDSKLTNGGARERSESLPRMLASASSLPGLGAPASLRSESFRRQNSSSNSPSTAYITSDGNNNTQNKSFQSSDASPYNPDLDDSSEIVQRRTSSFKRAMRFQPVFSQDLTDVVSKDVPMADDSVKMDYDSPATKHKTSRPEHQFIHTGRCDRSRKGRHELNNYTNSSPSVSEDSSDSDEEQGKPGKQRKERKKGSMYSSMPALHTLERRPAQKRRPGETKSGSKAKKDLSKSSDSLASRSDKPEPATTAASHQYRRRWEGSEDGLESKVPAMHDSYLRHSRENLLRRMGKCAVENKQLSDRKSSSGARLTDWGSVDKLTHGSMSDLSHLQEDPWVKLNDSPVQSSSPRLQDTTITATSTPNSHSRSRSMCVMESNDWNTGSPSFQGPGRPRNYSDVTQILQRPGKENLDWLVYVKRNIEDKEIRERANSLSKMTPNRSRTASGDLNSRTLRDSSPNIARSTSLCEDTLMRYSLDLPNRRQSSLSKEAGILASPRPASRSGAWVAAMEGEAAKDRAVTAVNGSDMSGQGQPPTPSEVSGRMPSFHSSGESPPQLPSESSQTPADVSQPPTSPITPRTSSSIQLLSPTPFSSKFQDATQDVDPPHPTLPPPVVQSSSMLSPGDHQQPRSPRPVSPHTEALSAEGDRMVAEMEKYYEINSPQTPVTTFKFPPTSQTSCPSPTTANSALSMSDMNINRLSGVSSVSSSSNEGCVSQSVGHPPRDVNPNRLSGVSSISTSSYDSQNSNSSDSLVGTLKNKLSVLTTKLGGKKSREEEATHHHLSASRDGLSSPTPLNSNSELQEVLREYSLGSPLIGSRMANTLPVGFEPLLSPQSTKDQTLSSVASKDETSSRFSFPSAVPNHNMSSPEAFPDSVQQADSGISMYSGESTGARPPSSKAKTLPPNMKPMQQCPDDDRETEGHKRRDSASSTNSGDSFYERRLSVAFEASAFNAQTASGNQQEEPQSPEGRMGHRKSIREVVQFIEEKFRPQHPLPVEVKRKEPSALIRQRLQSLRDNSSYKRRVASNRSVSEDRSRARERTPESPRLSRPENRSRSFNQFMHRVRPQSCAGIGRDRGREKDREREMATKRELELASRAAREQKRESEERSEGGASSNLSAMGSMDRLDQLSSDVDSLVIMRGWVRSLINKFQQIT